MFINYLFISGINYVTESAGKELMLAQIKEIQEDSESLEKTQCEAKIEKHSSERSAFTKICAKSRARIRSGGLPDFA